MAKKSNRKRLQKRLDNLCRDIIRLIYNNRCCRCGKYVEGSDSHPCHVVAKGNGSNWRRFDLLNIFLGCMHCHQWWHLNPIESGKWFAEKWPQRDRYLEKYKGGKPAEIKTSEMEELLVQYKQKYEELCREIK